jgi:hypothetical protein
MTENQAPEDGDAVLRDYLVEVIRKSIHAYPDSDHQPKAILTSWQVMQGVDGNGLRSRHLIGRYEFEGRVSSALVSFDLVKLDGMTRSGRHYILVGPPGRDDDAQWVWSRYSFQFVRTIDLTRALLRLRARILRKQGLDDTGQR